MIKKVLIIVPHADDEINIAGTIIDQLYCNDISIDILYITNGDYYPQKTKKRFKETFLVAQNMQVNELFFLGYGDKFGDKHIYQCDSEEIVTSKAGYNRTYGVEGSIDYRYLISGVHSEYKLSNLKRDMQDCILRCKADMLICTDFDEHPDHRMVSILFDEIMKELIIRYEYHPLILKKFAYAGVWEGEKDYFVSPMIQTLPIVGDSKYRRNFWQYDVSQEVRIKVWEQNYQLAFWKTNVYKWLKIYRSQKAIINFSRIVNADALYFYKDSYNLALCADITVSSGKGEFINDFKLIDIEDVCVTKLDYQDIIRKSTWLPDSSDAEKYIIFKFEKSISVKRIVFYQSLDENSSILKLRIGFNGKAERLYRIENINRMELLFEEDGVSEIRITVSEFYGNLFGFREIEIFDNVVGFRWQETPFYPYMPEKETFESRHIVYEALYKISLLFGIYIPDKATSYCKRVLEIIRNVRTYCRDTS